MGGLWAAGCDDHKLLPPLSCRDDFDLHVTRQIQGKDVFLLFINKNGSAGHEERRHMEVEKFVKLCSAATHMALDLSCLTQVNLKRFSDGPPRPSQHRGLRLHDGLGPGAAVRLHHVLRPVPGGEGAAEVAISVEAAVQTHAPPLSLQLALDLQSQQRFSVFGSVGEI